MKTLQEKLDALIEERVKIVADTKSLLEKDSMSAEDTVTYDSLIARNEDIKVSIKRIEAQIAEETDMSRTAKSVPKTDPEDTGNDKRHVTDVKHRDYVYPFMGMQLMDVANFTMNMDRNAEKRLRESRSISTPEQRAITGMGEMNPVDGGFLLQPNFATELIKRTREVGVINSKCRHITIGPNADSFTQTYLAESSRANGSRGGGLVAYWIGEGGSYTGSHPTFGRIKLGLDKLTALCYATDENLADATQLQSIIESAYAEEINYKLDDAVITGDGVTKPMGYLGAIYPGGMTVSVAKETGQVAATVNIENINKMWNRFRAARRKNAVWLINQDVEYQLDMLEFPVGTGGVPGYLPPGGLSSEGYSMLKGRPVIIAEQCPALGTVGDIMLVDLDSYLIIEKGGMEMASSIHVAFTTGQQVFRFTQRCNGQPLYASAETAANGGTARSECVVLATRA